MVRRAAIAPVSKPPPFHNGPRWEKARSIGRPPGPARPRPLSHGRRRPIDPRDPSLAELERGVRPPRPPNTLSAASRCAKQGARQAATGEAKSVAAGRRLRFSSFFMALSAATYRRKLRRSGATHRLDRPVDGQTGGRPYRGMAKHRLARILHETIIQRTIAQYPSLIKSVGYDEFAIHIRYCQLYYAPRQNLYNAYTYHQDRFATIHLMPSPSSLTSH